MPEDLHRPPGAARDVETELRRLAGRVDVPARPDYAARVVDQLTARPLEGPIRRPWVGRLFPARLRPLGALVLVLLAVLAVTLSVPAGRRAVADIFGITGVRVQQLPSAAPTPRATFDAALDLGRARPLAQARARVSFAVALPRYHGLRTPDATYLRRERGLESVSMVYLPRAQFPAVLDGQVGVLLSEYAGTATPYFDKLVSEPGSVTRVSVAGRWPGLFFAEPEHVFVRDTQGGVHFERSRLSAPSLVWERGAVTYRLEANVDQATMLAVAASLR